MHAESSTWALALHVLCISGSTSIQKHGQHTAQLYLPHLSATTMPANQLHSASIIQLAGYVEHHCARQTVVGKGLLMQFQVDSTVERPFSAIDKAGSAGICTLQPYRIFRSLLPVTCDKHVGLMHTGAVCWRCRGVLLRLHDPSQ